MASAPTSTGSAKVDAVVQKAAAAVPGTPTGFDLYARFALAGAIGCSVTHGALTPVDVIKTRIQLDPATYNRGMIGSFKQPTYANGLIGGFTKMAKQEGLGAFYAGFGPILFKQIPYTMAKFVVYEKVAEAIFRAYPKETLSSGQQTQVNLASGLIAGLAAAVVSQPADTMLSKINKTKGAPGQGTVSRLIQIAGELGVRGSFAGLPTRLFMVGTLTAGQFALYGDIKAALGARGSVEIAK
ncbi:Mitochondrial phosphate carrier protein like [Verticillium longisporum]|uniref:Mitochondrial phosphate carrier protein like n=1 Tax=Verticillium longisporum TaxID=100787 RepID=A0A8I3AS76_VERLO|nr:Mitochondrial phosphate carrier protein like [Verticillium longisporum]